MSLDPAPSRSLAQNARRALVITLAGVVLTAFFIYLGFPYDRLAQKFGRDLETNAKVQVRYGEVGPRLQWLGPGIAVSDLLLISDGEEIVRVDELTARPAWSLSWLRGAPSVYLEGSAEAAQAEVEIQVGDAMHVRGEVRDLDLRRLPAPGALSRASLEGTGDFDFDLHKPADQNWQGMARLSVDDGSFAPPDLKVAIPYTTLQSTLTLGPDGFLELAETELASPLVSGTAKGRIPVFPGAEPSPLDVTLEFNVSSPEIQNALRENEIAVSVGGDGRIRFGGSLAKPSID